MTLVTVLDSVDGDYPCLLYTSLPRNTEVRAKNHGEPGFNDRSHNRKIIRGQKSLGIQLPSIVNQKFACAAQTHKRCKLGWFGRTNCNEPTGAPAASGAAGVGVAAIQKTLAT